MLILNDSEGLIQFDGRDSMTGGLTFALLRPGKTSAQLEASFRAMDLKHTIFNEKNTVSASNFGKLFSGEIRCPLLCRNHIHCRPFDSTDWSTQLFSFFDGELSEPFARVRHS